MDWEPAGKNGGAPKGKKGRGCLIAVIAVVALIMIGGISRCVGGGSNERLDWPTSGLAEMLPKPDSDTGDVIVNSDDSFSASVDNYTREQYDSYVAQCQEMGFSVEAESSTGAYAAYSEEGYHLSLSFYDSSTGSMSVTLDAPIEMGAISWPTVGAGSLVPAPISTTGKIDSDSSTFFFAYVGETDVDAFKSYVDACSGAGFNVDYDRGDTWYGADNADGVSLRIEYRGFNTMSVRVEVPDGVEASSESVESEVTTPEGDTSSDGSAGASTNFRATMDAYEAFMNEYCDFMETYSSDSSNVVGMAADYADMMSRYSDMTEQIDAIDEGSLSAEDLAYYMEVTSRVNARLLEIGQ